MNDPNDLKCTACRNFVSREDCSGCHYWSNWKAIEIKNPAPDSPTMTEEEAIENLKSLLLMGGRGAAKTTLHNSIQTILAALAADKEKFEWHKWPDNKPEEGWYLCIVLTKEQKDSKEIKIYDLQIVGYTKNRNVWHTPRMSKVKTFLPIEVSSLFQKWAPEPSSDKDTETITELLPPSEQVNGGYAEESVAANTPNFVLFQASDDLIVNLEEIQSIEKGMFSAGESVVITMKNGTKHALPGKTVKGIWEEIRTISIGKSRI